MEHHHAINGKTTISMAIFHSYVSHYRRVSFWTSNDLHPFARISSHPWLRLGWWSNMVKPPWNQLGFSYLGFLSRTEEIKRKSNWYWLVVSTHLKHISQLGWLFPIYGKMFQTTNRIAIATVAMSCLPTTKSWYQQFVDWSTDGHDVPWTPACWVFDQYPYWSYVILLHHLMAEDRGKPCGKITWPWR